MRVMNILRRLGPVDQRDIVVIDASPKVAASKADESWRNHWH